VYCAKKNWNGKPAGCEGSFDIYRLGYCEAMRRHRNGLYRGVKVKKRRNFLLGGARSSSGGAPKTKGLRRQCLCPNEGGQSGRVLVDSGRHYPFGRTCALEGLADSAVTHHPTEPASTRLTTAKAEPIPDRRSTMKKLGAQGESCASALALRSSPDHSALWVLWPRGLEIDRRESGTRFQRWEPKWGNFPWSRSTSISKAVSRDCYAGFSVGAKQASAGILEVSTGKVGENTVGARNWHGTVPATARLWW